MGHGPTLMLATAAVTWNRSYTTYEFAFFSLRVKSAVVRIRYSLLDRLRSILMSWLPRVGERTTTTRPRRSAKEVVDGPVFGHWTHEASRDENGNARSRRHG